MKRQPFRVIVTYVDPYDETEKIASIGVKAVSKGQAISAVLTYVRARKGAIDIKSCEARLGM